MRENTIQKLIRVALARTCKARAFVNTNALALLGKNRRKRVGWGPGSPDLVGWHSVVITQRMVGKRIAVLLGLEIKVPGKKPEPHQKVWLDLLKSQGAICGSATSEEEAIKVVEAWEEQNL